MGKHTKRHVSMQDIADELHISKNAVSIALSDKDGISDELREKVIETATRVGYISSKLKGKTNNFLLFVVDERIQFSDAFFYPIFSEVMRYSREQGYQLLVSGVTQEMQNNLTLPEFMYQFHISGVLSMGLLRTAYLQKIMDRGLPLVVLVNQLMNLLTDFVVSDNVQGSFQLCSHLISKGHRKIGFISYIYSYRSFYQRWQGYQQALSSAGLPVNPEYSIVTEINFKNEAHASDHTPLSDEQLSSWVDQLLNLADPPTAWMCGQDSLAVAIIHELQRRDINVPNDISIVGFDNVEHAAIVRPRLTTMDTKRDVLSQCAVDLLLKHIKKPEAWNPVRISVVCDFVEGESVKEIVE